MTQEQLSHTMLLSIHKENTNKLDLIDIANMFCERNNERLPAFGVFQKAGLKLP